MQTSCYRDEACCQRSLRGRSSLGFASRAVLGTLLLLGMQAGCSPYHLAKRTLVAELSEYPQVTDGRLACLQYRQWAKRELSRLESESGSAITADYASGFLQGFVDQVYAGGKSQPPPVPPRKYWRVGFRNPRGEQAVKDYYRGFEHGASVAKEGGYRAKATVPSSLFMLPEETVERWAAANPYTTRPAKGEEEAATGTETIAPPRPTPAGPEDTLLSVPSSPWNDSARAEPSVLLEPMVAFPSSELLSNAMGEALLNPLSAADQPPLPPWNPQGTTLTSGPSITEPLAETPTGSGVAEAQETEPFDPFEGSVIQTTLLLTPPGKRSGDSAGEVTDEVTAEPATSGWESVTDQGFDKKPDSSLEGPTDQWKEPTAEASQWRSRR